ncbi:MAG: DoxX family protein [Gemmatimonadetes bacterium]|nr:DoxX family protein [Gemmatimonadota bacterium]
MFKHDHAGLRELTHNALRIVAGFLFMQHGAQKLFGALGGNQVEGLMSAAGIAGILEFFGGLLMMAGLLTAPVAFLLAGQMAVAYFWRHAPNGFWPIMNRGELAAFYSFTWLYFFATGPGKFSVDGWLAGRKAE